MMTTADSTIPRYNCGAERERESDRVLGVTETELHFLTECPKYTDIRDHYYPKINLIFPQFNFCSPTEKLNFILGEEAKCAIIAARFIASCHLLRDSQRETNTHIRPTDI